MVRVWAVKSGKLKGKNVSFTIERNTIAAPRWIYGVTLPAFPQNLMKLFKGFSNTQEAVKNSRSVLPLREPNNTYALLHWMLSVLLFSIFILSPKLPPLPLLWLEVSALWVISQLQPQSPTASSTSFVVCRVCLFYFWNAAWGNLHLTPSFFPLILTKLL